MVQYNYPLDAVQIGVPKMPALDGIQLFQAYVLENQVTSDLPNTDQPPSIRVGRKAK